MLLDQQPKLKEITEFARTAKWYQLGVQLELDDVDLAGCTDIARVYQLWIQQKAQDATRRNLLTALRAIKQNNVACQYEQYLKKSLVSSICYKAFIIIISTMQSHDLIKSELLKLT